MIILGMNSVFEHPSVAVISDGGLAFAVEEERLTRIKNGKAFNPWRAHVPFEGMHAALSFLDIGVGDVQEIAYSYDYRRHLAAVWQWITGARMSTLREEIATIWSVASIPRLMASGYELPSRYRDRMPPKDLARVHYRMWDHHLCHAASAAYCSGFDRSLVVVADGNGETHCTSVYQFAGGKLKRLAGIPLPHSLGLFYSYITAHLGFEPFSDEYKVMGLAAYGEPRFDEVMGRLLPLGPAGTYRFNVNLARDLESLLGPRRKVGAALNQRHFDIARSMQSRLEEALQHVVAYHLNVTANKRLCLAGGVFLNCVANSRLAEMVEDIYVQPAANDAGTAVGAAALSWIRRGGGHQLRPDSVFLGTEHDDATVETVLCRAGIRAIKPPPAQLAEALVERLVGGRTVALFRGRMEFGPRALGNRSIIASAQSAQMRVRLNEIKKREQFRPLAPIVTEEAFHRFFDGTPDRYMTVAATVRVEVLHLIPAVIHVDGTARPQVVRKVDDPLLYNVLVEFGRRTGAPVLVNTSLNVRGRPIDESPHDALASFLTSGLDSMLIGGFIVDRPSGTAAVEMHI